MIQISGYHFPERHDVWIWNFKQYFKTLFKAVFSFKYKNEVSPFYQNYLSLAGKPRSYYHELKLAKEKELGISNLGSKGYVQRGTVWVDSFNPNDIYFSIDDIKTRVGYDLNQMGIKIVQYENADDGEFRIWAVF